MLLSNYAIQWAAAQFLYYCPFQKYGRHVGFLVLLGSLIRWLMPPMTFKQLYYAINLRERSMLFLMFSCTAEPGTWQDAVLV